MYIPKAFELNDRAELIAFMRRYSFATIITNIDDRPVATPLPFVVEERNDRLVLTSHFALANPQATHLADRTSLVIFAEPHAYISPAHYDKVESVPTWNYVAVHAYGQARLIEDEEGKRKVLEHMIRTYEASYLQQWEGLSEKYQHGMMRGIVAFELEVTELQGKAKLSQNKTTAERERIISQLQESDQGTEIELAHYMHRSLEAEKQNRTL